MDGIIQLCNIMPFTKFGNCHRGRVYSANRICPTLSTFQGGGRIPMIADGGIDSVECEARMVRKLFDIG